MIYRLLVLLMAATALEQIGMTISEFAECRSRACLQRVEKQSRNILRIDWKPISVWPEEQRRFNGAK
jgi:hypothetical protein